MAVDDFYYEIRVGHVFPGVEFDYLTFVGGIEDFFLHNTLAYGGHLRTAVGIDDCGHDVAAESRTDLVEQVLVFLAGLGILVVADYKRCAVGRKARMEAGGYARTEVSADACGAHQADLRLDFAEEVDEHGCVGVGGVGIEALVGHFIHYVGTIGEKLVFHPVEIVAYYDGLEFHAELRCELAAFGEKFEAYVGHFAVLKLAIYNEVVLILHGCLISLVPRGAYL